MPYQHPCLLRGCNSDLAQYSITPRGRIRGQPVRRSFSLNAQGRPRKRGALHGRDVSEGGRTTTRTRTKRLVSAETRARGSARLYDPHVDPAPDFMDWYCKLREGKLFFHE